MLMDQSCSGGRMAKRSARGPKLNRAIIVLRLASLRRSCNCEGFRAVILCCTPLLALGHLALVPLTEFLQQLVQVVTLAVCNWSKDSEKKGRRFGIPLGCLVNMLFDDCFKLRHPLALAADSYNDGT